LKLWSEIAAALERDGFAALVTMKEVRGSSPREAGARMLVRRDGGFRGSIGGGALEHETLTDALRLLEQGRPTALDRQQALGPDLGQCCGGHVRVAIEVFVRDDLVWVRPLAVAEGADGVLETLGRPDGAGRLLRQVAIPSAEGVREIFGIRRTPVFLFGAGHVGRAVALALGPLPFRVDWIDSRADAFPERVPGNATPRHASDPAALVANVLPGTLALVMTHSHPLDLAIVSAALASGAFPYVGLIGSATKRARFTSQLRQIGLSEAQLGPLACPIGDGDVRDKSPAAIAAVAAVELLRWRERTAPHRL